MFSAEKEERTHRAGQSGKTPWLQEVHPRLPPARFLENRRACRKPLTTSSPLSVRKLVQRTHICAFVLRRKTAKAHMHPLVPQEAST